MTPELLRLMAYCPGPWSAAARKALDDNPCRCVHRPCRTDCVGKQDMPDEAWIMGLLPLYEAASTQECGRCMGVGHPAKYGEPGRWGLLPCDRCWNGNRSTGRVPDPRALLRLCVAVGRACWDEVVVRGDTVPCVCDSYPHTDVCSFGPKLALDAVEAWLKDPTDSNMSAWCDSLDKGFRAWIPMPYQAAVMNKWRSCLEAAAKIVGMDTLRRLAVETLTAECSTCIGQGNYPDAFCLARKPQGPSVVTCEDCEGTGRLAR